MKSKIVFSLLLVFSLVLSACASTEANSANIENEEETNNEETEASVEEVEVEETEPEQESEEVEETEETAIPEPATFHIAFFAEPDTLDPHKTGSSVSQAVLSLIGAALVDMDIEGNIVPSLAESWEVSEDGLTYTFHLHDDVVFQNGIPLTAQDFVYTYERAMDPETASVSTGTRLGSAVDFQAPDDYTFVITLEEPFFPFLTSIAVAGYMQPLLQSYVEEMGEELGRYPMSVGPYRLVEWVTGDHILLEKNPDFIWGTEYYGSGPYMLDYIEINFISELSTIIAGLEVGEIDYATIESKDYSLFEDLGFDILSAPMPGLTPYIALQTQTSPLDDINIRIALNKAVDRQAILTLLEQGNGEIQFGPLSSTQIGYWEEVEEYGYPYDPDGARELIEASGYALNADGIYEKDGETLSFELMTLSIESWVKTAEVIQSMFKEVGVSVDIMQEEAGVLIPRILGGDYQMSVFGISLPEADVLYQMFHSSQIGGYNYAYVNNPELDVILEQTRILVDPEERQQAVNDAQKMIAEQAYIVPLYSSLSYSVMNPRVKGYVYNPYMGINLTKAYIEE